MTVRSTARPTHAVHFYDSDEDLLPAVTGYVSAGLFEGCVTVIATPEHLGALNERLDDAWVDAARAENRYLELDAERTLTLFMRDGWPDRDLFQLLVGSNIRRAFAAHPRARGYGEMVGLLLGSGQLAAALALESLWNDVQQRHPFPILCAYPRKALAVDDSGQVYQEICDRHSQLLTAG